MNSALREGFIDVLLKCFRLHETHHAELASFLAAGIKKQERLAGANGAG